MTTDTSPQHSSAPGGAWGGAQKKAILRTHDGSWLAGYLVARSFLRPDLLRPDAVELLDLSARRQAIPLTQLKWACFVRDFNSGEASNPERLLRTTFSARPRMAGVWLRLLLKDETVLEGLAANGLSLLDPGGLMLTPPDTRSNTQRIFVPRASVVDLTVLAVIAEKKGRRKPPAPAHQADLFAPATQRAL